MTMDRTEAEERIGAAQKFRDKITAMTFTSAINKVSGTHTHESNLNEIIKQINEGNMHTAIIKAIVSDDITYPEKRAVCEAIERSEMSVYELYQTAKKEIDVDINDLYKASQHLSAEAAKDLRMDILMYKVFHNETIHTSPAGESKNIPGLNDFNQNADDISL